MFSKAELSEIKACVETVKELLQTHLDGKIFTEVEKCEKREEVEMILDIVSTIEEAERDFVSIDADMLGSLYTQLENFKGYMQKQVRAGHVDAESYGDTMYRIGYLQARTSEGLLTNKEFEEILQVQDTMED